MTDIHIEVVHTADKLSHGEHFFDCDNGPLAIPPHIRIGLKGWDGTPITRYHDQVGEYAIWLEDQIKARNFDVCHALEEIFQKAMGPGIILTTRCCPDPYITHAHEVKKAIMELASNG